jgi:6-phosphofructokinase 1
MQRIAVLTSGGDAPGMNAAVRAIVRAGIAADMQVYGVQNGYAGLLADEMTLLAARDVSGILRRGGTFLGSARCDEFHQRAGRERALDHLRARQIGALVVIGGNGSQSGAHALLEMGYPVVGVASTIDNDLEGTDITIGADTAINVALEAIDRLKVTAASHRRAFLVETMGRDCGYVALMAGIAGGAEVVSLPEQELTPQEIAAELRAAYARGKSHALAVVAEGARYPAQELVRYFEEHREETGFSLRVTILGHVQRGAAPTASDRLLASRLGAGAIRALEAGRSGVLVGLRSGQIALTPLEQIAGRTKTIDLGALPLAQVMAI